jgi:hypothetical protein
MLSGMAGDSKIWKWVPFKSALNGLAKEAGVWGWLLSGLGVVVSALFAIWGWLESNLPYWAIALIFFGVLIVMLHAADRAYAIILKRKYSRTMDNHPEIDRDELADEVEAMSGKIAALVGEFRGPMQEAWWNEARNAGEPRLDKARIEGKLVEKFSDRYGASVWVLIRTASKVVSMDRSELWGLQSGIRGEREITELYMFLARLAADIRNPAPPLPENNRRSEEANKAALVRKVAAAEAAAALASASEPKKP